MTSNRNIPFEFFMQTGGYIPRLQKDGRCHRVYCNHDGEFLMVRVPTRGNRIARQKCLERGETIRCKREDLRRTLAILRG